MLNYSPTNRHYPGDEKMRACTQQSKKNRSVSSSRSVNSSSVSSSSTYTTTSGIGKEMLDNAGSRLCGFLDDLLLHEKSMTPIKSKGHQVCHCCGKPAYHCCKACPGNPALLYTSAELMTTTHVSSTTTTQHLLENGRTTSRLQERKESIGITRPR